MTSARPSDFKAIASDYFDQFIASGQPFSGVKGVPMTSLLEDYLQEHEIYNVSSAVDFLKKCGFGLVYQDVDKRLNVSRQFRKLWLGKSTKIVRGIFPLLPTELYASVYISNDDAEKIGKLELTAFPSAF
ncbi:hypothetical protein [Gluconacetobacter asukensis]